MHPLKKNHKKMTVEGGGGVNPYGEPDRKIPVFYGFPLSSVGVLSSRVFVILLAFNWIEH